LPQKFLKTFADYGMPVLSRQWQALTSYQTPLHDGTFKGDLITYVAMIFPIPDKISQTVEALIR
jgi:hypothetical protein